MTTKLTREISRLCRLTDEQLERLMKSHEPSIEQLDEQRRIGFADGSTGKRNRYEGDESRLGRAYQVAWRRGVDEAQNDINQTCIEG